MRVLGLMILLLVAAFPARAQEVEVDVELLLLVDVSRSMSPTELEIQRRGYAEAILSPTVIEAVRNGLLGRTAVSYVEWAGSHSQRVVVDWMLLEDEADARAFADSLTATFSLTMRRTSLSGAIDFGARSLRDNGFRGLRRVMDISGDGPNNEGGPVLPARDAALAQGLIINGLPLMTEGGRYDRWSLEDLDQYYLNCVIGGPGAFAIPVTDWAQFAEAVRRKLVLELVGTPVAVPQKAQYSGVTPQGYDCLIGEKMWESNRRYWTEP
ncbi:DUF1194 domain-containing protein [Oceaniglobus roseus]|uniref:DUF1194 domain-containing protein n=1 Tax=Oceaniglobus roseus TaxID=1737570 RepID=UPI000C7F55BD|nr:DUF1194 domain-containing protein [Kandeliimicrobium roseum]